MVLTAGGKQRMFYLHPADIAMPMLVKASAAIFEGAPLEFNGGYVEPANGAGIFAGFAQQDMAGGASDGLNSVMVQCTGLVDLPITTETPAQTDVGAAASVVEATDDDTFRIERAATITGTPIGKIVSINGTTVKVSFRAAHIA
jgi:hypothetical protein